MAKIIGSYKSLYDTVAPKYENINDIEADIETGLRYVKYYYPDYKVPKLITLMDFHFP